MVKTSVLNDALNAINNAEKAGRRQVLIRPSSKVIIKFLSVMQKHGYIGEFEEVDDHRSGKIVIQLNGRLNKTGVINPRYPVQLRDLEKWTTQLLPSRGSSQARCWQAPRFLLLKSFIWRCPEMIGICLVMMWTRDVLSVACLGGEFSESIPPAETP
ncbi:40S ribosomal uS8 domain-containing protein [Aspergillus brunneoviolaceus CBS 621.78]|uniref:Ribosomal protein S8 n=1 Tax=Aspergillus brunneoviolaceus CBS 621.78 TaxID=1450534 RepID=A0ACD1GBB5_9EURO|nr:ribosomal protein S8 [Aspergillus brunneoviolaceus CBS 621.78]RAH46557.1 ribosomal protein S8 [Aspergillus brunneoviolaceus CBS 621.78]